MFPSIKLELHAISNPDLNNFEWFHQAPDLFVPDGYTAAGSSIDVGSPLPGEIWEIGCVYDTAGNCDAT